MFYVSFRSTLPVLPLLLVLSPVNSSSCAMENKTTEIRVKYENILSHDINELAEEENKALVELGSIVISTTSVKVKEKNPSRDETIDKDYSQAKEQVILLRPYSVNISAENRDRCCKNKNRENTKVFFCNDTQEIGSLQSMACNMLRFFHKQRISKAFRWKAAFVSCGTLQVLQCKCEGHKKEKICPHVKVFGKEDTERGERSRKKCNQEVCELKENVSSLRSCWNKFEKIISR